ncbi:MAG: arginine N-succinyltransferase [Proteobacteria bacterium]|nr:arginine N-succinyltransferase [Pseudomonadota bacterium]MBU4469107.1 arginine N-succinyltransferase [Pseudomonadota bacterium]
MSQRKTGPGWIKVLGIIVGAGILASILVILALKFYIFPTSFTPVTLSAKEEKVLEKKIEQLNAFLPSDSSKDRPGSPLNNSPLEPEAYSEEGAKREIEFTEKEFNALIAKNTDLANKLAVDFSGDLASIKLLVPLDPDFPMLGGKTLKVAAGVELAYTDGRPVVKLRGVSLWGVPLPNAWLGNMKNVDLIREYGNDKGFWHGFAEGVDSIKVEEGSLKIKLKP